RRSCRCDAGADRARPPARRSRARPGRIRTARAPTRDPRRSHDLPASRPPSGQGVIRRAGDEAEGVYPSPLSSPPLTVEPTVLDRLGDVGGRDTLLVLEIGDRARHAEHAVVAAGRQPEPAHGGGEQALGLGQEWADPTELTGRQLGVHPGPRFAGPGALALPRRDDAGPDGG